MEYSLKFHILDHKASPNKYKNIKHLFLLGCNVIKLEIHNKRNYRNHTNIWRLNHPLLNDQSVIEEIREEILKFLESNGNGNTSYQNLLQKRHFFLLFFFTSDLF
jgi:uncharacterized protein YxjI